MSGDGHAQAPKPSGAVVFHNRRGPEHRAGCMTSRHRYPHREERHRAVNLPASAFALISANVAANALHDYFLANADRGDNAANEALLHRIRAERIASGDGH